VQGVFESIRSNPLTQSYIGRYQNEFAGLQQQFQQMMDQYANRQQEAPQPTEQVPAPPQQEQPASEPIIETEQHVPEPIIEIEQPATEPLISYPTFEDVLHMNEEMPQLSAVIEEQVLTPAQEMPSISQERRVSVSSDRGTDWTFVFNAKGISGYVRHVKSLGERVPFNRNFCASETWTLPDGNTLKVELVHALHPDAPFICLLDCEHLSDIAFVQTLLDGTGKEIHRIDSFTSSYHGFTCDMLLQSAMIDDQVRIKIEAIPSMD